MPPFIISMIVKKFLPRIIGVFLLSIIGISAAIWFLEGWPVFFTSLGVIILSIILVPVVVILDLVKMLGAGKELKEFLFRKRTKQEFMSVIMQKGMSYFMQEQMGAMFGGEKENKKTKKSKTTEVIDVKDKEMEKNTNLSDVALGLTASTTAATLISADSANTQNESEQSLGEEDPMEAMMQMMNNPEVQAQMAAMMQMMMSGSGEDNDSNQELDLSMLLNMGINMEEEKEPALSDKSKDRPDIEDVDIKK